MTTKTPKTPKTTTPLPSATPMTPEAVRRIQSATAEANGGRVPKESFAARAQRVVAKRGKR